MVHGAEGPKRDPFIAALVATSNRAGAKRDFDPGRLDSMRIDRKRDKGGPFTIAVARGAWQPEGADPPTQKPPRGRLVVFGDSDFATNTYHEKGASGNLMLLRNTVAWAAGKEYKISIPPKTLELDRSLNITRRDADLARWATVIVPPFHILFVGIVVWWIRRR